MGNFRNKDVSIFNDYDVVITTYGTMLRDIEFLRKYNFITSSSMNRKPSKIRWRRAPKRRGCLKAEHRLVMTGTPVENNTFELWSQFAFLNPGLLGSMDYFKRVCQPHRKRGDEENRRDPAETGLSVHLAPHQGTSRARTAAAHRTHRLHRHGHGAEKVIQPKPASDTAPNCWA
jgi:hypothetical protein